MNSDPSAFILAAGFGTRLKPWTEEYAKPLIPVAGVEALFFALYRVSKAGIKKTFVNAHYKSEQIETALKEYKKYFPELSINFSKEEKILGTGGGILKIIKEQDVDGGLITLNGDTLSSLNLSALIGKESAFAVSYDETFFSRYNPVYLSESGDWVGLKKGESLKAAHILGAHFLSPADISLLKKEPLREVDLFSGIYDVLKAAGRSPKAVEQLSKPSKDVFWFDLTNKDFLLEAKARLSGPYFPLWKDVLLKRHPTKSTEEALSYWPLKAD